ncbi:hypothetical protein BGZ51_008433 [Haplosporangium sp. Z 767]|nr:hypothetical protein BGZ51_008433 [Haplosporangium sp. Z 767]KAF9193758.1 hypothetical protein BGZ50_007168 [Haplosporangium sp. Z 11]
MKTLGQNLVLGLVLSLSLSSNIFLSTHAQGTTNTIGAAAPKPTATATGTAAPAPSTAPAPIDAPTSFKHHTSAANKNYIYIHGGQINSATLQYSNELYALDLTKSWPISAPAWKNMTVPTGGTLMPPKVGGHSATMSKDGTKLWLTAPTGNGADPFLYEYNTEAGTWSTFNAPAAQAAVWTNRKAAAFVTDPSTGTAWFFGGSFADGSSTNEIDRFRNGDWTAALTATVAEGTAASAVLNNFSSGTAHIYNSRIYIFGGFSSTAGQRGYQSFQSLPFIDVSKGDAPTFGTQLTLGPIPSPRQNHCSVLTESAKVIIFGGYDQNSKSTLQDVWSLDLVTMTWVQILTTNGARPRHNHVCNIAGANMVVFGGLSTTGNTQVGYGKDVQVYDVMQSSWMNSYAPKQDTTKKSDPISGGYGSSGLGIGPIIGIVAGALVVVSLIVGFVIYKRRQKRIEIREAELEKEAYLASLRPEGREGSRNGRSPGHSPSSKSRMAASISTPGVSHSAAYNGMDELLLQNAAASPGMGGQAQGNVQYLMQHLPDGTIAVQPVYLDRQAIPVQTSPNMAAQAESPNLGGSGGYVSPPMTNNSAGGYFAPPPGSVASPAVTSAVTSPYLTYPQPTHDPFASPALHNAPLPPGYQNASPPISGMGSPQRGHPEQPQ